GEWFDAHPDRRLTVGRTADLVIDDNPDLEGVILSLHVEGGLWWIESTADARAIRVGDPSGRVATELRPGSRAPLVLSPTQVVFSANRTTYEFSVHGDLPYTAATTSAERRPTRIDLP